MWIPDVNSWRDQFPHILPQLNQTVPNDFEKIKKHSLNTHLR